MCSEVFFFQWMVQNLSKTLSLCLFLKIHLHSGWDTVLCSGFEIFAFITGLDTCLIFGPLQPDTVSGEVGFDFYSFSFFFCHYSSA